MTLVVCLTVADRRFALPGSEAKSGTTASMVDRQARIQGDMVHKDTQLVRDIR